MNIKINQDGRDKVKLDPSDCDCDCLPGHKHTSSPPQSGRVPQTGGFLLIHDIGNCEVCTYGSKD